jgi:aspartyl-tRNA(Asn)/glutamyl-tRNA(Gln) amidotransferase subunit A
MQPPTVAESDVGTRAGFMDYLAHFGRCTRPASFLGLPAISVPAGLTHSGLPCGFQLIGRPFDESTLLALAHAYEKETRHSDTIPLDMVSSSTPNSLRTSEAAAR